MTPASNAVGWVASVWTEGNYFGDDDMYTGFRRGVIYHGAIQFDLSSIPPGSRVLRAELRLTGKTADFLGSAGEWRLRLLDPVVDDGWANHGYSIIHGTPVLGTIAPVLSPSDLGAGDENVFIFSSDQLAFLDQRIATTRRVSFRLDGPQSPPDSLFSWYSGYSSGVNPPGPMPSLHLVVSVPSTP